MYLWYSAAGFWDALDKFGYSIAYGNYCDYGILPYNNRYTNNVLNSQLDYAPDRFTLTLTTLFIDKYFGFSTSSGDRFDNKAICGSGLDSDQNNTNNTFLLGLTVGYKPFDWWENELSLGYLNVNDRYNNKANPDQVRFQDYDYFSRDLQINTADRFHRAGGDHLHPGRSPAGHYHGG